ncbi:MAG: protein kinase [Deltaproteobacteria bacterium]|nr:protein kinase [Deltaproteobacteria bacterium]
MDNSPRQNRAAHLVKVCPTCHGRYPEDFRVCPRDAAELQQADDSRDDLIGVTVGNTFQIVRAIGEGGMARVYEACHTRLPSKRFAVKVMHPAYAQQSTVIARFQQEAEAASGIAHPNVVNVFDVGHTPDGLPYMVTEYLEGKDFGSILDDLGKIDATKAVHVVRQVCRALSAAHARGIVHRDIKPENVFLVGDLGAPIVKVIDFGISKVDRGWGTTLTRTGMIMGTPAYIPPEQARGGKIDYRADIYGVGAMLYRALTGCLPFEAEDTVEALSLVLTQEPPRPCSLEPSIPEALELVIQKAMAKNPDERYQSMAALDEDLAVFDVGRRTSLAPLPPKIIHSSEAVSQAWAPTILQLQKTTWDAKLARPTLLVLSLGAYLWGVACLVEGFGSALALFRGQTTAVSLTEKAIISLTVIAASVTPGVFWGRHLLDIWRNSVRTLAASKLLRHLMLAAIIPYAAITLVVRLIGRATSHDWNIVAVLASILSAAMVYAFRKRIMILIAGKKAGG